MPFYSREICEEVRDRNDIVDVILSYMKLEKRGGRYFGLCPFHTEKTPSFSVSPDMQIYHCFGCNESGNVVSFVMKYESMEFTEAIEFLADRAGMQIKSQGTNDGQSRRKNEELLSANKAAAEYFYHLLRGEEGKKALSYFTNRGLSPKTLSSFGLGYSGKGSGELHKYLSEKGFSDEIQKEAGLIIFDEKRGIRDRFFNRVMFPIMDVNNKVIAFGGRVMGDGEPKYINSAESPIFNKSRTWYGLFAAKRTKRAFFILCEGYLDVISAHQAGFDNCIASMGTALTEAHVAIIKRYKRPVILCYDSDKAGRAAAIRGYEILKKAGVSTKIMDLSPYKDPDELIKSEGPEEFERRISEAKNAFLVIRRWEYEETDTNDPDAVTAFMHSLARHISEFKDESERENYIRFAAREFSIKEDVLRRTVNDTGNRSFMEVSPTGARLRRKVGINKEKALVSAEGTLLFFLTDSAFFAQCKGLIEREDFSEEAFKELYDQLCQDAESERQTQVADLISMIEDEEKRSIISESFFAIGESEDSDMAKVRRDTLLRVKKAALKRQKAGLDPTDVTGLQKALEYAREVIEEIEKLNA